jgi:hemoglobin
MTEHVVTEQDIARLVPEFYARIRRDPLLGPIFGTAIVDWPLHVTKLQAFWSSVMLTSGRYKGQPMVAHVRHEQQMSKEAFARWLAIWTETSRELLSEEAASAFQDRAARIAESLQLGIQFYRDRKVA